MEIQILPAYNGDCILINNVDKKNNEITNILIDGGISRTYPQCLKSIVEEKQLKNEDFNLLIITHVDDDHLGGIIKLFEDTSIKKSIFKKVWFNCGENISNLFKTNIATEREIDIIPDDTTKMSIKDGITLENILKANNILDNKIIKAGDNININNIQIKVLSPSIKNLKKLNKNWVRENSDETKMSNPDDRNYDLPLKMLSESPFKKDGSIANGSSIAILLTINMVNVLLLADAHENTIVKSLKDLGFSKENPLPLELVKLSHHGSKKNTGTDLLEMIKCNKYIVSTDGSSHNLPNKEVFARILKLHNNSTFYFNYKNDITLNIFTEQDKLDYIFDCKYLDDTNYKISV